VWASWCAAVALTWCRLAQLRAEAQALVLCSNHLQVLQAG